MLQVWAMKLTESTNICCISDRVPCTIKVNITQTIMETMVSCKRLCGEWTAVREYKTYYLTNLVCGEGRTNSCYSVPTLENPWTYVKSG